MDFQSIFSALLMVLGVGSGPVGVGDLLDGVDAATYFEKREIEMKVDPLIEVVEAKPTRKLDEVKAQEVSKLMAIRALGQLGDKKALPALQKVADSKKRFLADYAKVAIASLGGEKFTRPAISAERMQRDLAFLPKEIGLILQCRLAAGRPADLITAAKELSPKDQKKAAAHAKQFSETVASVASRIGNARLDGLTYAISNHDPNDGDVFIIALVRGLYDSKTVEAMFSEIDGFKSVEVGGILFSIHEDSGWGYGMPSDDLLVIYADEQDGHPRLEEIAKRIKADTGEMALSPSMQKLVKKATPSRLWGVVELIDVYRDGIPQIAAFDHIIMGSKLAAGRKKLELTFTLEGQDPVAVKNGHAEISNLQKEAINEVMLEVADEPRLQGVADFLANIKSEVKGKQATFLMTINRAAVEAAAKMAEVIEEDL